MNSNDESGGDEFEFATSEYGEDDDEERTDETDEFWFNAGQNSVLSPPSLPVENNVCNNPQNTTFSSNNKEIQENKSSEQNSSTNFSIGIGKMADLMNKTMKFERDESNENSAVEILNENSKFDLIDVVTRKFVRTPSAEFSHDLFKLLQCLCFLCDQERCVTCFLQADGLRRLYEIVKRFVTVERFWIKYHLNQTFDDAAMFQREIGLECIRLLACMSCFQTSRFRFESAKENFIPYLIAFVDPMNSIFSATPVVDDDTRKVENLILTAVNPVKAPLFIKRSLPVTVSSLSVFVYDGSKEDDCLNNSTSVWPYQFDDIPDLYKINFATPLKKTVNVVNLVDACTFWAIDPIEQRRTLLEVMQISGTKASTDLGYCKSVPSIGDVLLAPGDKNRTGPAPNYRCLVVELINLDACVVFALDFGFFDQLSWKRLRLVTDRVKIIPAAAFLCVAKDMVAALDEDVAKLVFVVLQNCGHSLFMTEKLLQINGETSLCDILRKPLQSRDDDVFRNFLMSAEYLRTTDLQSILLKLLKLPLNQYESILFNVIKIFLQFSAHTRVRSQLTERNLIEIALDLSLKIVELCKSDESKDELLVPIVKLLSNMCTDNLAGRQRFEKCKGLILPMCLIKVYPDNHPLHKTSTVLLKHVFNVDKVTPDNFATTIDNLCNLQISDNRDEYICKLLEETIKLKSSIPKGCCFSQKLAEKYVLPVYCNETYEKCRQTILIPSSDVMDILKRISLPPIRGRFYMKNSYFELDNSKNNQMWTVFFDIVSARDIKQRVIQEYVCAALNSRCKLTLYFGVTKEKQVKGFAVDLSSRDQLRVGIDFALNKAFRPVLEPHMYSIQFVPVFVGGGASSNITHVQDKFVMEIQVHHCATDVYQFEENGKIYVKLNDSDNIAELYMNEARNFFAKRFENVKEEKLCCLKRDIEMYECLLKR